MSAPEQTEFSLSESVRSTIPKLVGLLVMMTGLCVLLSVIAAVGWYRADSRRVEAYAATNDGKVIPLVALDKPYVTEARVIAFADECTRRAFSHDFQNYRQTMNDALECFTTSGATEFSDAIEPRLDEIRKNRMVMAVTVEPPVVQRVGQSANGSYRWDVQTVITIYEQGTTTQRSPVKFVATLRVQRVPLEENARGISISSINVAPATNISSPRG